MTQKKNGNEEPPIKHSPESGRKNTPKKNENKNFLHNFTFTPTNAGDGSQTLLESFVWPGGPQQEGNLRWRGEENFFDITLINGKPAKVGFVGARNEKIIIFYLFINLNIFNSKKNNHKNFNHNDSLKQTEPKIHRRGQSSKDI